jgi:hypothetical protein
MRKRAAVFLPGIALSDPPTDGLAVANAPLPRSENRFWAQLDGLWNHPLVQGRDLMPMEVALTSEFSDWEIAIAPSHVWDTKAHRCLGVPLRRELSSVCF